MPISRNSFHFAALASLILWCSCAKTESELIADLSAPKASVRSAAALEIGARGSPDSIHALLPLLSDSYEAVQVSAIRAMAKLLERHAEQVDVPAQRLIARMNESLNGSVADAAVDALGKMRRDSEIEVIAHVLQSGSGHSNPAVTAFKFEEGYLEAHPLIEATWIGRTGYERGQLLEVFRELGIRAIPALIGQVNSDNAATREGATSALMAIGLRAVPALTKSLGSGSDRERIHAAIALGSDMMSGDESAAPALVAAVERGEPRLRVAAAIALRLRQSESKMVALKRLAADSEPVARAAAVIGLRHSSNVEARRLLEAAVMDPTAVVRKAARRSLEAMKVLPKALWGDLDDVDPAVREEAAHTLAVSRLTLFTRLEDLQQLDRRAADVAVVAGAYEHFVARGGSAAAEDVLIAALHQYGHKQMATLFANSGNGRLRSAATAWASRHGFYFSQQSTTRSPMQWGGPRP